MIYSARIPNLAFSISFSVTNNFTLSTNSHTYTQTHTHTSLTSSGFSYAQSQLYPFLTSINCPSSNVTTTTQYIRAPLPSQTFPYLNDSLRLFRVKIASLFTSSYNRWQAYQCLSAALLPSSQQQNTTPRPTT